MLRTTMIAAAIFVSAASMLVRGLPAFGQVELKWKLVKGQTFVIEDVVTIQQTIKLAGKRTKIKTKQTKLSTIKVLDVDEDGGVKLEMRIDSITSKGDGKAHAWIHKKMAGAIFHVSLDRNMQITKFEGYDKMVENVTGGNPQKTAIFRNLVSEKTIQRTIDQTFSIVPAGPVGILDTWQRPTNLPLGALGQLMVDRTFTYAGKGRLQGATYDKLTLKATARYQRPKAKGQTLVILKADVKIHDYDGIVYFDAAKGRLVQTDEKTRLKGSFLVKTAQGQTPLSLVFSRTSRRRVLDPKR